MRTATLLMLAGLASAAPPFPDPQIDQAKTPGHQKAVLAGGCFWCTEAVFERLNGVENVVSGFAGGDALTAHYKKVSEGKTDHAESIEITYNPARITYGQLLKVFFSVAHDPTTLNRQGPDWGKQYRSAVFCVTEEQKKIAQSYIGQLDAAKVFKSPIVTEVVPFTGFYPAEEYHQDFVRNNPDNPYVVVNSEPKLEKLKKMLPDLVKK